MQEFDIHVNSGVLKVLEWDCGSTFQKWMQPGEGERRWRSDGKWTAVECAQPQRDACRLPLAANMSHYTQLPPDASGRHLNGNAKWPPLIDPAVANTNHYKTAFSAYQANPANAGLLGPNGGYRPPHPQQSPHSNGSNGYPSHYHPANLPQSSVPQQAQSPSGGYRTPPSWQGVRLPTVSPTRPLPPHQQHHQASPQQQHLSPQQYLSSPTSGQLPPFSVQLSPHQRGQQHQQWPPIHSPPTSIRKVHSNNSLPQFSAVDFQSKLSPTGMADRSGQPLLRPSSENNYQPPMHSNIQATFSPPLRPSDAAGPIHPTPIYQRNVPTTSQAEMLLAAHERWQQQLQSNVTHQHQQEMQLKREVGNGSDVNRLLNTTQEQTPTPPGLSVSTNSSGTSEVVSSTVTPPSPKYQQISPASSSEQAQAAAAANQQQTLPANTIISTREPSAEIVNVVDDASTKSEGVNETQEMEAGETADASPDGERTKDAEESTNLPPPASPTASLSQGSPSAATNQGAASDDVEDDSGKSHDFNSMENRFVENTWSHRCYCYY